MTVPRGHTVRGTLWRRSPQRCPGGRLCPNYVDDFIPRPQCPVCFGFSREFICSFYSPCRPFTLDLRPRDASRSRPYPKSSFMNPTKSTKHFLPRIFVPIRHPLSRPLSHRTRQPTLFGSLCILVFASHRLKRPSTSSPHRTLHRFTSILLRGKFVTFVGFPATSRSFFIYGGSPTDQHVSVKFTLPSRRFPLFSSPTTPCISYPRYYFYEIITAAPGWACHPVSWAETVVFCG